MGSSKFAKVFFSGLQQIKNRNPRHQCVLWSEEIIWIWCFYCSWLKSRTWTGASCLFLEHPKHQPTALFRMASFVWNAKGKGNRNSSFHKYLEQSLEPSPAGLWLGEKCWRVLSTSLPCVIFVPESKTETLPQLCMFTIVLNMENGLFQIGWCGYDF